MNERMTGRSFRAVLKSLEMASSGKDVYLLTPHGIQEARRLFDMAMSICANALHGDFKGASGPLVINFSNGGSLYLSTTDKRDKDQFRGIQAEFIEDV